MDFIKDFNPDKHKSKVFSKATMIAMKILTSKSSIYSIVAVFITILSLAVYGLITLIT